MTNLFVNFSCICNDISVTDTLEYLTVKINLKYWEEKHFFTNTNNEFGWYGNAILRTNLEKNYIKCWLIL